MRRQVLEPDKRIEEVEWEEEEETKMRKHWQHINFEELPEYMKDNEFIRSHYRPELRSYTECLRSIFGLHTESGNIWSHLLGCIIFIGFVIKFYSNPNSVFQGHEIGQKIVFCFFFIGVTLCLSLSTAYHTLSCHSDTVKKVTNKLDYVGISLLIVGSYIPWIYYGFYCHTTHRVN